MICQSEKLISSPWTIWFLAEDDFGDVGQGDPFAEFVEIEVELGTEQDRNIINDQNRSMLKRVRLSVSGLDACLHGVHGDFALGVMPIVTLHKIEYKLGQSVSVEANCLVDQRLGNGVTVSVDPHDGGGQG